MDKMTAVSILLNSFLSASYSKYTVNLIDI